MMKVILSKLLSNFMILQGKLIWISKRDSTVLPNGFIIHFKPEDKVQVYGHVTTIWKYNVYGKIEDDGIIIDAGANIGVYSLKAAEKAKQVISIEPEPEIFSFLKHNIEVNNLKNVDPINTALSDHDGFMDFYISRQFFGEAHEPHPRILHSAKRKYSVPCVKLDSLLLRYPKIKEVSRIKMDVEGHAAQVLAGAKDTLKKGIIQNFSIAVYHYRNEERQIKTIMENYGYVTRSKFFLDGDIILYAKLKR